MTNDDLAGRFSAALWHGGAVAAVLTVEDLILYDHLHTRDDDPILDLLPYTVGVATILCGYTALKAEQRQLLDALEAWIVALCGGAAVTVARAMRRRSQTSREEYGKQLEIVGRVAGGRHALETYQKSRAGDRGS